MTIKTTTIEPHWNYFLAIERDLDVLSRFIEFDERNFESFSLEIARLLLAAAAEADIVCKQICRSCNPMSAADNIHAYRDEIVAAFPGMASFTAAIPRFGLELCPWENWQKPQGVPAWWTAHNKIKHERNAHYDQASLKNALNAVAGLFVATLYRYPEAARLGQLVPTPQLLRPSEANFGGVTVGDIEAGINYRL